MTTLVTIENSKDSEHIINVTRLENGLYTDATVLSPGEITSRHVWGDSTLNISEGYSIIVKYKNPKGLKGVVYIEDDGTIRELCL